MTSDRRVYRAVLAYLLMSIVEIAVWVTVMLYAYERGGVVAAGIAASLSLVPAIIVAPLLGTVGDRFSRGTALVGAYAITAAVVALLGVLLVREVPIPAVVVGAALVTIAVALVRPLHYSSMPLLSPTPQSLVWANSATAFAAGLGAFVGPAVAGVAAATLGSWSIAAVSAVALVVSSLLCLRLNLAAVSDDAGEGPLREAVAGLRHVGRDSAVLAVLGLTGLAYVVTGALEILGISFAATTLGVDESGQGLLVGAVGLGSLGGALAGAGLAYRRRLSTPAVVALVAAGIPLMIIGGSQSLVWAVLLLALFGAGERFSALASETLLQRSTDDAVLSRVFAVWEAVMLLGYAIGTLGAPLLIAWRGDAGAFVPLGVAVVVLTLALWRQLRRLDDRAVFRTDVLTLVRGVPFLAAMRPAALDRLSNNADWEEWPTGGVVITQGDEGDSYYIVAEGELNVSIDGQTANTLRSGEGFGEVGLLLDIPRSATVTATRPTRLLVIERDEFLAAVMRSTDGRRIAMRIAAARVGHPSVQAH